jgi:hypothetical protein
MVVADVSDSTVTTKYETVGPCPICLTEYHTNEILCWSQNEKCNHVFHRDCMEEWLLRNDVCPCCRTNYLDLDGFETPHRNNTTSNRNHGHATRTYITNVDNDDNEDGDDDDDHDDIFGFDPFDTPFFLRELYSHGLSTGRATPASVSSSAPRPHPRRHHHHHQQQHSSASLPLAASANPSDSISQNNNSNNNTTNNNNSSTSDDSSALLRGMHLFYLLSRLQTLAETQGTNTTIRLEGLELSDGRRGNFEIQSPRSTSTSSATASTITGTTTAATATSVHARRGGSNAASSRTRDGDVEMSDITLRLGLENGVRARTNAGAPPSARTGGSSPILRTGRRRRNNPTTTNRDNIELCLAPMPRDDMMTTASIPVQGVRPVTTRTNSRTTTRTMTSTTTTTITTSTTGTATASNTNHSTSPENSLVRDPDVLNATSSEDGASSVEP